MNDGPSNPFGWLMDEDLFDEEEEMAGPEMVTVASIQPGDGMAVVDAIAALADAWNKVPADARGRAVLKVVAEADAADDDVTVSLDVCYPAS